MIAIASSGSETKKEMSCLFGSESSPSPIFTSTSLSGPWPTVFLARSPCPSTETRHSQAQEQPWKICLAIAMLYCSKIENVQKSWYCLSSSPVQCNLSAQFRKPLITHLTLHAHLTKHRLKDKHMPKASGESGAGFWCHQEFKKVVYNGSVLSHLLFHVSEWNNLKISPAARLFLLSDLVHVQLHPLTDNLVPHLFRCSSWLQHLYCLCFSPPSTLPQAEPQPRGLQLPWPSTPPATLEGASESPGVPNGSPGWNSWSSAMSYKRYDELGSYWKVLS